MRCNNLTIPFGMAKQPPQVAAVPAPLPCGSVLAHVLQDVNQVFQVGPDLVNRQPVEDEVGESSGDGTQEVEEDVLDYAVAEDGEDSLEEICFHAVLSDPYVSLKAVESVAVLLKQC